MRRAALYMVLGMVFLTAGYLVPEPWGPYCFLLAIFSATWSTLIIFMGPRGPGGVL